MFNGPVIEIFKKALAEHLFEFKRTFPQKDVQNYQYTKVPRYITNGVSYKNKKHFTLICTRDLSYDEIIFELGEEPLHWAPIEAVRASPSGYNGDEFHILCKAGLHYKDLRNIVVEAEQALRDLNDDAVCGRCEGAEAEALKRSLEQLLSNALIFGLEEKMDFNQKDMWSNISNWSLNTTTLGGSLIKLPEHSSYPNDYIFVLKDIKTEIGDIQRALEQYKRNDAERAAKEIKTIKPSLKYYSLDTAYLKYLSVNKIESTSKLLLKDIASDRQSEMRALVKNYELPSLNVLLLRFKDHLRSLQIAHAEHQHRSWFTGGYHVDGRVNNARYEAFSTKKIRKRELKLLLRQNIQNEGYDVNCIVPNFKNIWHQNAETHSNHRWPVSIISQPEISTDTITQSLGNIQKRIAFGYCKCCLDRIAGQNSALPKGVHQSFTSGCQQARESFIYFNHAHKGARGYSEIDGYLWNRTDYLSKLQNIEEFKNQSYFVESKRRITLLRFPSDKPESGVDDVILIVRDESLSEADVFRNLLKISSSLWNRSECYLVPNNVVLDTKEESLRETNTTSAGINSSSSYRALKLRNN